MSRGSRSSESGQPETVEELDRKSPRSAEQSRITTEIEDQGEDVARHPASRRYAETLGSPAGSTPRPQELVPLLE